MNYLCAVKLTLKIKLLPNKEQEKSLLKTIEEFNTVCNEISNIAWDNKTFNTYKLHHLCYHKIKSSFKLSAQLVVRAIAKVSDSYKLDKKVKREFRLKGAVTYDSRIMTYLKDIISLSTINGRIKVPFVCHRPDWLPYIKGEADLICRKGKYFLLQTVEFPEEKIKDFEEFIGVDFGRKDIAVTSEGKIYSSEKLNKTRNIFFKVRKSVQTKADNSKRSTKRNCHRVIKRLSGREQRFATNINHTISKQIVQDAKLLNKGIAIEDLSGIRESATVRKKQKREHHSWAFFQLRQFLTYKSLMNGIPLVVVQPQYTSKTCNNCKRIGNRQGKDFKCKNCGYTNDADKNASLNISQLGNAVIVPEKSAMFCSLHS